MSSETDPPLRLSIEVVARDAPWTNPVATATDLLSILTDIIGGWGEVSRDEGDWTSADLTTSADWFEAAKTAVEIVGPSGRHASLARSPWWNMARVRDLAVDTDRSELVDSTLRLASAMPDLSSAEVRTGLDRWPIYRDHDLLTLGDGFDEMLDWIHVLPPGVVEQLDRDLLLRAPAAAVEERDGWIVLVVFDDPTDAAGADATDRIVGVTRHLQGAS